MEVWKVSRQWPQDIKPQAQDRSECTKPAPTGIKEKDSQEDTYPASLPMNIFSTKVRKKQGGRAEKDQEGDRLLEMVGRRHLG